MEAALSQSGTQKPWTKMATAAWSSINWKEQFPCVSLLPESLSEQTKHPTATFKRIEPIDRKSFCFREGGHLKSQREQAKNSLPLLFTDFSWTLKMKSGALDPRHNTSLQQPWPFKWKAGKIHFDLSSPVCLASSEMSILHENLVLWAIYKPFIGKMAI